MIIVDGHKQIAVGIREIERRRSAVLGGAAETAVTEELSFLSKLSAGRGPFFTATSLGRPSPLSFFPPSSGLFRSPWTPSIAESKSLARSRPETETKRWDVWPG